MTYLSDPDIVTVMESEKAIFRRCRNCSRYFPVEEGSKQIFCSKECAVGYSSCIVCGRYFKKGTGAADNICSEECSTAIEKSPTYRKAL